MTDGRLKKATKDALFSSASASEPSVRVSESLLSLPRCLQRPEETREEEERNFIIHAAISHESRGKVSITHTG